MDVVQLVSSACRVEQNLRRSQFHIQFFTISPYCASSCWKPVKRFLPQCRSMPSLGSARRGISREYGNLAVKIQERQWKVGRVCSSGQVGKDANFPTDSTAGDESVLYLNSPFNAVPDSQNESEDDTGKEEKVQIIQALFQGIVQFVDSNFLPVALIIAMLLGLMWPTPGQALHRLGISKWVTTTFFLIFGLTSGSREVEKAASAWPAGIFGMISILLLTPLAAIPVLWLPVSPRELATGLAIFASVPTTLSSGVALTQIAGANTGLALGLTVFSNLFSVVSVSPPLRTRVPLVLITYYVLIV